MCCLTQNRLDCWVVFSFFPTNKSKVLFMRKVWVEAKRRIFINTKYYGQFILEWKRLYLSKSLFQHLYKKHPLGLKLTLRSLTLGNHYYLNNINNPIQQLFWSICASYFEVSLKPIIWIIFQCNSKSLKKE